MGILVYSLFWLMQDLYHRPYNPPFQTHEPPQLQDPKAEIPCRGSHEKGLSLSETS